MTTKAKVKTLYVTFTEDGTSFEKIVLYNDRKFKIRIIHRNGTPLGFNDNCCLSIMTSDGTWKGIEDNRTLNLEYANRQFANKTILDEMRKNLEKGFLDYITSVY